MITSNNGTTRTGLAVFIGLTVLGASMGANVVLFSRLLSAPNAQPGPTAFAAGARVGSFTGKTQDGQVTTVKYDGQLPTIVYFFSPQCGWCERNWSNVRTLLSGTNGHYRVLGVSLLKVPEGFLSKRHVSMQVLTDVPEEELKALRVTGTPRTLVVGTDGRVIKDWFGAYNPATLSEVQTLFALRLPGLDDVVTAVEPQSSSTR